MSRFFDGVDDKIDLTWVPSITGARTALVWIYLTEDNNGVIINISNGDATDYLAIGYSANNNRILATAANSGPSSRFSSINSINVGQWTHLAVTKNTGNIVNIYVNGVIDTVSAGSSKWGTAAQSFAQWGALFNGSFVQWYDGFISNVYLYDRILSTGEINQVKNGFTIPGGLQVHHPLWGSQSPEPDFSGNKNNGVLDGTIASKKQPPTGKLWGRNRNRLSTFLPGVAGAPIININLSESIGTTENRLNNFTKMESQAITASNILQNIFTKMLSDSSVMADIHMNNFVKMLSNSLTQTDTFFRQVQYLREFTETITQTDNLQKIFTKMLSDSFVLNDQEQKIMAKILTNSITQSDTIMKNFVKMLEQSITQGDTVVVDLVAAGLLIALSESITQSDSIQKNLVKMIGEIFTLSEDKAFNMTKMLSDSITQSDTVQKIFTKILTDSSSLAEVIQKVFSKQPAVTISQSDEIMKNMTKMLSQNITQADSAVAAIVAIVLVAKLMTFLTRGMIQPHDKVSMTKDLSTTATTSEDNRTMQDDTDELIWDWNENVP